MSHHYAAKKEIKSKVDHTSIKKASATKGMMKPHGGKVLISSQHVSRGSF